MTPKTDWTGRRIEVEVGAVAHGGHCVARHDNRVLFVRHALPGEVVVAEVIEDKGGSFCRADAVEVLRPSADRVDPPCPVAVPGGCGGCDFQHATPAAQRSLKASVVQEQLKRLAGLEWDVEVEALAESPLGWRTRVRLAVDRDGRAGLRGQRSHRVIPIDDCPITVPGALPKVLEQQWTPGAEVQVTHDGDGSVHVTELQRDAEPRLAMGTGTAVEHAAGRDWRVDANGFWQVHPAAADTLVSVVTEFADTVAGATVWDLYGGVGLFGAALAERVGPTGSVTVVETSTEAVESGRRALADLPQVKFVRGKVERVLGSSEMDGQWPDAVVLDPPRKGAGRAVVEAVCDKSPRRVVHVACDPAALARDVADFAANGYRLAALRAFDAFPMTHHIECVALFTD
ncbi:class I SAM-dependent RNA methyltransferase [Allokutzneria albata]|uniref:tRNA/tmRNA/rRNA uracil-C5-methylase, TrmA/RlmC/RlmD family n=1 Tax=Allokutzneria albata TaxID=211114 RepID=A0A1G9WU93_ALLAB|nr:class I SAM-dependent RNA methyltransferase [Allokutzneria albata]SDM87735.1 tRNA/tmRNA/rRNA uracil-C5-methylase, TrmA/RlmC/RlmD family [Allokutzneria albata]